jgi:hypothetical protein
LPSGTPLRRPNLQLMRHQRVGLTTEGRLQGGAAPSSALELLATK